MFAFPAESDASYYARMRKELEQCKSLDEVLETIRGVVGKDFEVLYDDIQEVINRPNMA